MTVLYLTEKIVAYFKKPITESLKLVAVKNSDQKNIILPAVDIGDFVSVIYDRKEKVYIACTKDDEYSWTANDLAIHKEAFQERFKLDDSQPLYVLVKHIQEQERRLFEASFPGINYVMMHITEESKYGNYQAIYQLPNTRAIHPFVEKLVEQMVEKEPEADESNIRYSDLNEVVEIDIDIAEYMIVF
ncbi:hypothetical protein ACOMCU_01315 [Lysinibacillus sp. UGB7]|uniref:hypothetical protein n=1 Tax=Lysinibacillus sp. UGB7 TaxID=3411039 RepID=UPI003B7B64B0